LGPLERANLDHWTTPEAEAEVEAEAYCRQTAGTLTPGIGPAGTHDHIFVQCQDLLFSFPMILLIDKGGVGLFYIYRLVFTYYTLLHLRLHYFFLPWF
jgi:hypothetical protein